MEELLDDVVGEHASTASAAAAAGRAIAAAAVLPSPPSQPRPAEVVLAAALGA